MPTKKTTLEVKNFGIIREARLSLSKSLTIIGGRNGQGKTTLGHLAIAAAVGGKKAVPGEAVTTGEKRGSVALSLGDVEIVREFNDKGSWDLTLRIADEPVTASPESRLSALVSKLSFSPAAFYNADAKTQVAMLLAAAGVDFTDLDAERKKLYDDRTQVGRERDSYKGALAEFPLAWDPPAAPLDVAALSEELQKATQQKSDYEAAKGEFDRNNTRLDRIAQEIIELNNEVREITGRQKALRDSAVSPSEDKIAEMYTQMRKADVHNEEYRQGAERTRIGEKYREKSDAYEDLSSEIAKIDAEKVKALTEAKLPLGDRLKVGEDGITLDGYPLSRASGRDRANLAVALAIAQVDPAFPLVSMDMGEAFDAESLPDIEEMAGAAGVWVILTRVATDATCTVIMDDGRVLTPEEYASQ